MAYPIRASESVCGKARVAAEQGQLLLESDRARILWSDQEQMGAVILKVSFNDYLKYILQSEATAPNLFWLPGCDGHLVIALMVRPEIRDGKTYVDGREVVFL